MCVVVYQDQSICSRALFENDMQEEETSLLAVDILRVAKFNLEMPHAGLIYFHG